MEHPERREPQTMRRGFEYRDVAGNLIGRAEVELDDAEVEIPRDGKEALPPVRGHAMRSFTLRGEKDGQPTEVDMLALANARGIKVIVTSERQDNYDYDEDNLRATVPPLETPTDVGVFLHELGHAEQYGEERFHKTGDLYGAGRKLARGVSFEMDALKKAVAKVRDAVPEVADLLTDDLLDEFGAEQSLILEERAAANAVYVHLLGARAKEKDQKKHEELAREASEARMRVQDLDDELQNLISEFHIREFVTLPTSILERDATRRAFQWARKVRLEAGIDLFTRHVAPDDPSMPRVSECGRSVTRGMQSGHGESPEETDLIDDLKRALGTYGADSLRLRHPHKPGDIGITPTVGRRGAKN